MSDWAVEFYETARGRRPVQEYLDGLPTREADAILRDVEQLQAFGLQLPAPLTRSLGSKLWELRTRAGRQHRVLYFAASGRRLVLLHAFTKKTQKTPRAELDTAADRLADYQQRGRA